MIDGLENKISDEKFEKSNFDPSFGRNLIAPSFVTLYPERILKDLRRGSMLRIFYATSNTLTSYEAKKSV